MIKTRVLGIPGLDNALFTTIDTGQFSHHLLFDCGDVSLYCLGRKIIQAIDHLFFSHCHMDHIAGFDGLLRHVYSRYHPLQIWGPKDLTSIIHSRLQGFSWNLVSQSNGKIIVHEVTHDELTSHFMLSKEQFKKLHFIDKKPYQKAIYEHADFHVQATIVDHQLDCLSYSLKETDRINISAEKLNELGLKPGPWCQLLKSKETPLEHIIEFDDQEYSVKELREKLMHTQKGYKISYVTDLIHSQQNLNNLLPIIKESDELIIESSYKDEEASLAKENHHLTVSQSADIANKAKVKKMILFHLSDRYTKIEMAELLADAKSHFPEAYYPNHWTI